MTVAARLILLADPPPELVHRVGTLYEDVLAAVESAVAVLDLCLGGEGDGYRSVAFEFVSELRGHPMLRDLDADGAADAIEPLLEQLVESGAVEDRPPTVPSGASSVSPWSRALGWHDNADNPQDPCEDFLKVWPRIELSALSLALERAASSEYQDPEAFGPGLRAPRRAPFRRFLAVCRELVLIAGERGLDAAALPVEALARLLGSDRRTVGGWRQEAEHRGFIRLVTKATPYGGIAGRAAEYQWIAGQVERVAHLPEGGAK